MNEPEIALVFTDERWVESFHRYCSDHGGARVRALVVDPSVAREERYDVLVAGHRWPPLTRALVADLHARGHAVLGVYDREERASREHLLALDVDDVVASDDGADAFIRAIVGVAGHRQAVPAAAVLPTRRAGRLVAVGGAPGAGRTEVAFALAITMAARASVVLVDADDVGPAIAARAHLPLEPNLRSAIDAVEHGLGSLAACVVHERRSGLPVVVGAPNAAGWEQMRPGEVVRVVDQLGVDGSVVVADIGAGVDDAVRVADRPRHGTARALLAEADDLVAVCDASPHGVARLLAWAAAVRALAPVAPMYVVVNRAPRASFRRAELFEEIRDAMPVVEIVFAPYDERVVDGAWEGTPVVRGRFVRAIERLAAAMTSPATAERAS